MPTAFLFFRKYKSYKNGAEQKIDFQYNLAPRDFGDLGRMAIYFRELGSTGSYFKGYGEEAHIFGDLGSPAKK